MNFANNSSLFSIRHLQSCVLASILIRPFLNSSGRVKHFVVLVDLVQASLEQFKGNLFALILSLKGHLIHTLLVLVPVVLRLW